MAEPLSGVAATATTGDGAVTGSAVSSADGTAPIWLRMSRVQYLRAVSIAVRGVKLGYNDGAGTLSSLPDYETAKANGFDMLIYMQKGSASTLNISPQTLTFPSTGGSQTVQVSAPDGSWQINNFSIAIGVSVEKASDNKSMTVTFPAGITRAEGLITVTWGTQVRWLTVYRSIDTSVGTVAFTGSIKNASTGAGIAWASVTIRATYTDGTTENAAMFTTNSLGNYTAAWEVDSATWGRVSSILVAAEAAGYQVNTAGLVSVPDYATATANPVSLPTVNLTPAQSSWGVIPATQTVAKSGGTATVNIQGTDGTEVMVYQKHAQGGGYDGYDTANITVSKSGSTITVTFGQNAYSYTRTVYIGVTWQGVQKYANITQN
jgi:hypothetical protein